MTRLHFVLNINVSDVSYIVLQNSSQDLYENFLFALIFSECLFVVIPTVRTDRLTIYALSFALELL